MPDLTAISAAFSSLKAATDIAKFLKETDVSFERADLKLKLAELFSTLADTKMQLVELQEGLAEKDKKIAELEEAFQSKDEMVRRHDAYYTADESGNPKGVPFCSHCWDVEHKKRQLVVDASGFFRMCTACKNRYQFDSSGTI